MKSPVKVYPFRENFLATVAVDGETGFSGYSIHFYTHSAGVTDL